MSKRTYHPAHGDILHLNFSPSSGRKFTGPHYGLVLSTVTFSKVTGLCMVVPATTKYHPEERILSTQLMVELPTIPELKQTGWVYTHQIKTIDYRERDASFVAKVEDDFLIDVMDRVRAFIDPDSVV